MFRRSIDVLRHQILEHSDTSCCKTAIVPTVPIAMDSSARCELGHQVAQVRATVPCQQTVSDFRTALVFREEIVKHICQCCRIGGSRIAFAPEGSFRSKQTKC
jgi:hypothetical protein